MIKSSTLRCSFGSIQSSGLNLPSDRAPRGMKHATWQLRSLTSNSSMRRAPLSPAIRRRQLASTPQPSGVTRPSPVITTRRGIDILRIVGDLAAELLLEGHHQLDGIQAVGTQIINETGAVGDLVGLDPEVLHHNLLHARCDVAHCSIPWLFADSRCCRVPKTGWGQAHARNCAMARADSRPDSRLFPRFNA